MHPIESALEDLRNGKMIIVVDDEHRENEGDLVFAAEYATPQKINFMAKEARGLICVPMEEELAYHLNFHPMVPSPNGNCNLTVSVDLKEGITTGISAGDRSLTIQKMVDPSATPNDFIRPGHMFPLIANPDGVLSRPGHTEATVDLMKLANLNPLGVICEIMNDDGTMARRKDLETFAQKHKLRIITIHELIEHRKENPFPPKEMFTMPNLKKQVETNLSTQYGTFRVHVYKNLKDSKEHVVLVLGNNKIAQSPLVRIHSECLTGDIFQSKHCDCGEQLNESLKRIQKHGCGALLYLRQEGRGIGLSNKMKAYALQSQGLDTVQANIELGFKPDLRDYGIGALILKDLGFTKIDLLTNNPEKITSLEYHGIEIKNRIPIQIQPNKVNLNYMKIKKNKMGHLFDHL